MNIYENQSLKAHNTFGIDCQTRYFAKFQSEQDAIELLKRCTSPLLILGGGSNILLTQDFPGTVLKNEIKGIEIIEESDIHTTVKVGGGEVWHDFVLWSIEQGLSGIENLSLIPGSVGAAPMQNIGAYGVEISAVFQRLDAISIVQQEKRVFNNPQCQFGYRSSIFKGDLKGKYVITYVYFRLNKKPNNNTSYGAILSELSKMGVKNPSVQDISTAVINIRERKLPNPRDIGNSGSFFKNPIIPIEKFFEVQKKYPHIVGYTVSDSQKKVAAGWLIEQAGWKGYRKGDAGIHENHALVLVNYGTANGMELMQLSKEVQTSVWNMFGIALEAEVNIISHQM
ncbi:MAG: UDP-N-acetylenolpyruvoylglucosamine reductase [Deltaproteobacteria bacterium]|nr:UDP-N-acetylenolpyruvoylglucosamine reductase [Deltaproteobacteria bacterium]